MGNWFFPNLAGYINEKSATFSEMCWVW